ncbi:hypothetical protein CPU12_00395 [Malaciobacter molluscorum LMG 25693]|uniref:PAS sensor-containing two-component system response regulator n=1 Tax=Malaciobacter molluscorum LMG 25693 TaxID=870501 RepID=A0A2G1DL88_9BACT|nr:response regulator [Malaciobacter molluscorum]AXX92040.1 PAS sensor-containing two-component system response regulator [Malaciobacter molluscorum LMG 25693]PHO19272.1 hypothetical protein CPU12_00395 [Malaciobacter molluscorum LMG 25693]
MINKEFLKKLTILYVEDEDLAREKLAKTLTRLFKTVYLAPNGMEGYLQFQKLHLAKTPVDLVLSDINMPKMSGIEMLEQIRELDEEVPFIFTTARSESENLLRAIELKANHYILKPIDTEDVILKSQEVCQKKYYERMLTLKNQELQQYLNAIDNIAIVVKFDEEGKIYFANSAMLESIEKNQEEILETNIKELIHKDISKDMIEDIFNALKQKKSFKGELKFSNSKNEPFYTNNNIFEIIENEKNLFISIGFLSTEENIEKREFKKKVIKNIQEHKELLAKAKNQLEETKLKLSKYENILPMLKSELELEKKRNQAKLQQIKHYEDEKLNIDEKQEGILKIKNKQIEDYKEAMNKIKREKELLIEKIHTLEEEILAKKVDIEKKQETIEVKNKRIEDLNDVIKHRESQLRELDPKALLS